MLNSTLIDQLRTSKLDSDQHMMRICRAGLKLSDLCLETPTPISWKAIQAQARKVKRLTEGRKS